MRKFQNSSFGIFTAILAFATLTPGQVRAHAAYFDLADVPQAGALTPATAAPARREPDGGWPAGAASVHPADPAASDARARLDRQVMRMELAFQVLNAVDAAQTIYCLNHDKCVELNPIIGRNPSSGRIIAQKAATGGLHYLVARALSSRSPRAARVFEIVSLAFQSGIVAWNFHTCF